MELSCYVMQIQCTCKHECSSECCAKASAPTTCKHESSSECCANIHVHTKVNAVLELALRQGVNACMLKSYIHIHHQVRSVAHTITFCKTLVCPHVEATLNFCYPHSVCIIAVIGLWLSFRLLPFILIKLVRFLVGFLHLFEFLQKLCFC